MAWKVTEVDGDNERGDIESRSEAEDVKAELEQLDMNVEIVSPDKSTDGGTEAKQADVVDSVPPQEETSHEPTRAEYDLPEKPPVDEDPITWMPGEFTDTIEGTEVINRKGYEVMAHHYGISTESECLVGPEDTDFEFCRVHATATKEDGTTYQAHGSAHVERGDDSFLLLEMADTRARKRAIAQATGTGMLAVEELQNKP